jgi:hypothetical protein
MIGMVGGLPLECGGRRGRAADQHIRPQPHQLLCEGLDALDIAAGPKELDIDIPSLDPAQVRKPLPECHDIRRTAGILLNDVHQNADVPHSGGLLGTRRHRPRRGDSKPGDELPASHRDLLRWIRGAYPGLGCIGTDTGYLHQLATRAPDTLGFGADQSG